MTSNTTDTDDTPTFTRTKDGLYATRIRAGRNPRSGKSQQLRVVINTKDEAVFFARLDRLRRVSAALTSQGLTLEASVAIRKAAAQDNDLKFEVLCETALALAPKTLERRTAKTWLTFRDLGEAWSGGALHRRYHDQVEAKATSKRDAGRLAYLYGVVVDDKGRRKLGDMPLADLTYEHASAAMAQLPPRCKRPAARRQYAQLIGRVLKLAVFPCEVIAASPLKKGWLPKIVEGDILFQHFYPDEDEQLMRCESIDYAIRVLFGMCNREGGRLGEFLKLGWSGIDAKRGTLTVGMRKGGRPGTWKAEPGTIEALMVLRELGGAGPFSHLPDDGKWAARLHEAMRTAGLDREALYHTDITAGFQRMRGHDTRATYVTIALAAGCNERHIMDRTGHRTSKMVHKYDHAASAWRANEWGRLLPLDEALGLEVPAVRRAGWVTAPRAAGGPAVLTVAAVTEGAPVAALPPGESVVVSNGGTLTVVGGGELFEGARPRALPPGGGGRRGGGEGGGVSRPLPRPMGPTIGAVTGASSGDRVALASTVGLAGGETPGETISGLPGLHSGSLDEKSGVFYALVAPAGFEPARREARDFKCHPSGPDDASTPLTTRTLVTGNDANARDTSPDDAGVRRVSSLDEPVEVTPIAAPTLTPTDADPVLAALRAGAHAAVERGDATTVALMMRAIEAHLAGSARGVG